MVMTMTVVDSQAFFIANPHLPLLSRIDLTTCHKSLGEQDLMLLLLIVFSRCVEISSGSRSDKEVEDIIVDFVAGVFCAKCTTNSVPVPSSDPRTVQEDLEKIRIPNLDLSSSPSAASFISTRSCGTANSSSITGGSLPYMVRPNQQAQHSSRLSPPQATELETSSDKQGEVESGRCKDPVADIEYRSPDGYAFSVNSARSDDDDDEYGAYRSDSETRHSPQVNDYYRQVEFDDMSNDGGSRKAHLDGETIEPKSLSSSPIRHSFGSTEFGRNATAKEKG
ncbi:hypothetical protein POTOM_060044 [Populus tomentosa]|uniref:Uncharacterized protein n=1 Tax=Populus tomentosa TaxID=118781 RepID=A0A8X8BZ79_POPTO|nr:hypothetical protein POTOM_060044 [Populus tomentosa]